MIPFHVAIHCLDWKPEMTAFPNLLGVGGQTVASPAYRWRGATRRDDPHILFQLTLEGRGIFIQGGRRYEVAPGFGFLCQSHNPGIAYHYPRGGRDPWTFLYLCFVGRSAMAMAEDLVRQHGPISALDTSDALISRMKGYADLAPAGSLVSSVADGADLVVTLLHKLLISSQNSRREAPRARRHEQKPFQADEVVGLQLQGERT